MLCRQVMDPFLIVVTVLDLDDLSFLFSCDDHTQFVFFRFWFYACSVFASNHLPLECAKQTVAKKRAQQPKIFQTIFVFCRHCWCCYYHYFVSVWQVYVVPVLLLFSLAPTCECRILRAWLPLVLAVHRKFWFCSPRLCIFQVLLTRFPFIANLIILIITIITSRLRCIHPINHVLVVKYEVQRLVAGLTENQTVRNLI